MGTGEIHAGMTGSMTGRRLLYGLVFLAGWAIIDGDAFPSMAKPAMTEPHLTNEAAASLPPEESLGEIGAAQVGDRKLGKVSMLTRAVDSSPKKKNGLKAKKSTLTGIQAKTAVKIRSSVITKAVKHKTSGRGKTSAKQHNKLARGGTMLGDVAHDDPDDKDGDAEDDEDGNQDDDDGNDDADGDNAKASDDKDDDDGSDADEKDDADGNDAKAEDEKDDADGDNAKASDDKDDDDGNNADDKDDNDGNDAKDKDEKDDADGDNAKASDDKD